MNEFLDEVEHVLEEAKEEVEAEFDKLTGQTPPSEGVVESEVEPAPVGAHTIVQSCFGRESADVPPIATTIATPKGA